MERIWWNQVTNAVQFVSQITDALLNEKSIVLNYSENMPWHDFFEETVRETVKQGNSEKKFEDVINVDKPGDYILKEFCKPEKRAQFRPSKGYAKFLAESNDIVLHDRYLWVKISSEAMLNEWAAFVSDYIKARDKNSNSAVFILDWNGTSQVSGKKGLKTFSFDEFIGDYDRVVFAMLASSSVKERPFVQTYTAELVSQVVENDIELCAACLRNSKRFLADPYKEIKRITEFEKRSDGTTHSFSKNADEVEHAVWLAQIRTIYPIIEEYREVFVSKYSKAISAQLPITSSYGEEYKDPQDVEIGTLKFMADNGNLTISTGEYEKLKRFKDARNKLSHLNSLSMDEINELKL